MIHPFGPSIYKKNPEVKNDHYLKLYNDQGPDIKDRLTLVLEFIHNPDIKLDPLKVPIQFDNVWLAPLKIEQNYSHFN